MRFYMKKVYYLVVLGLLACVTGCQKQSSGAQPVSQENDEVEQVIEETVNEGSSDAFAESEKIELSEQDFSFEYAGNTFSISGSWSDYVDALGYPDEYEQNNYGYVSTNSDGTIGKWSIRHNRNLNMGLRSFLFPRPWKERGQIHI